jgi:hypothetical protein
MKVMLQIKRKMLPELKKHLSKKEISLIIGARQVGKTTLMKELMNQLPAHQVLFLSLDNETDRIFFQSQQDLIKKIKMELGSKKGYVFIDEIQRKEDAGLFLKGIYDMDLPYKLIVSGSGSLELKEKIHESLTGRKQLFELDPVTFEEFVDFKTNYKYDLNDFFEIEKSKTLKYLEEYLNFGGYPNVIIEETSEDKINKIGEIYNSYIEKDIAFLLKVEKTFAFNQMIKLLSSQTGQILNYNELSKQVGISVVTLKNYLMYAEKTFIIKSISPFFQNKQKEITKSPVIYFNDLGLRNFSLGIFGHLHTPHLLGFVFQNFIANIITPKLRPTGIGLKYWRTLDQAEVDFIIDKTSDTIPLEVKYQNLKSPEITKSLRSFINKYNPKTVYIINLNFDYQTKINNSSIIFLPFYKLFNLHF